MSLNTQLVKSQSSTMTAYSTDLSSAIYAYVPSIIANSFPIVAFYNNFLSLADLADVTREIQYAVFGQSVTDLPDDTKTAGVKALSLFQAFVQNQTPETYEEAKEALRAFNDNHGNQLSKNAAELERLFESRKSPRTEQEKTIEDEEIVPYEIGLKEAQEAYNLFIKEPTATSFQKAVTQFYALHDLEDPQEVNKMLNSIVGENIGQFLLDYYIGTLIGDSTIQVDLELVYQKYRKSPFVHSVDHSVAAQVFKVYLGESGKTAVDEWDVEYLGEMLENHLLDVMENHTVNEELFPYMDETEQRLMIDRFREQKASDFMTPREELERRLKRVTNKIREGLSKVALDAALRQQNRIKQELAMLPEDKEEFCFSFEQVRGFAERNRASFLAFLG